jgi:hypothetical protein
MLKAHTAQEIQLTKPWYAEIMQSRSVQELARVHLQMLKYIALGNDGCGPEAVSLECHKNKLSQQSRIQQISQGQKQELVWTKVARSKYMWLDPNTCDGFLYLIRIESEAISRVEDAWPLTWNNIHPSTYSRMFWSPTLMLSSMMPQLLPMRKYQNPKILTPWPAMMNISSRNHRPSNDLTLITKFWTQRLINKNMQSNLKFRTTSMKVKFELA